MANSNSDKERDPDEQADLYSLIAEVVPNAEHWMNTPNEQLGGLLPRNLIGTSQEANLRDLVRSIKIGMFS